MPLSQQSAPFFSMRKLTISQDCPGDKVGNYTVACCGSPDEQWRTGWWFQLFFIFYPYLEKWSNLSNMFEMGWNHQSEKDPCWFVHDLCTVSASPPRMQVTRMTWHFGWVISMGHTQLTLLSEGFPTFVCSNSLNKVVFPFLLEYGTSLQE